jgi:hypothetical protein
MQISPIKQIKILKNRLSDRTKVKILKTNFFLDISQKKFGSAYAQSPRKCFEHRNSEENRRKRSENFPKIYKGHIRI